LLELAAFADGTLDEDDRERVAAWLAADPDAMADVTATRALASSQAEASAGIVARASAVHPGTAAGPAEIVRFSRFRRQAANWNDLAHWGSLAAAVVVAGWLGFNLGIETWSNYSQIGQGRDEPLRDLLDPSAGFMRDLTDAAQT
jgi:anti-sigma factor RsiW